MNTQETNPNALPAVEPAIPPNPSYVPPNPPLAQPTPQYAVAQTPYRRSPGVALFLSFFPGLGHLYLGLYQRAVGIFLAFAAAIFLTEHSEGAIGILIPFVWFFGVIDAYRQACCLNAGGQPDPALANAQNQRVTRGSLGFGVFLTLVGVVLLYNQFYPIDFTFLADWWPLLLIGAGLWMVIGHLIDRRKLEGSTSGLED